jgi:16S rRNA processing protein RimM
MRFKSTPNPETPTDADDATVRWVRVGKIVGFHGVRGNVKVRTVDDTPDWLQTGRPLRVCPPGGALPATTMHIARGHQARPYSLVMGLTEIQSRNDAEPWLNADLFIQEDALPKPKEPDTYRAIELVGLAVVLGSDGRRVGTVRDILSAAAGASQDFIEIQPENLAKAPVMIPFQKHFFPKVDPSSGRLEVFGLDDFLLPEPDGGQPAC